MCIEKNIVKFVMMNGTLVFEHTNNNYYKQI